MKRIAAIILAVLLVCTPFCFAAFAGDTPTKMTDAERDVTFTVPAGWSQDEARGAFGANGADYTFISDASTGAGNPLSTFNYASDDYFTDMEMQRRSYTRSDMNSDKMSIDLVDELGMLAYFDLDDTALSISGITKETVDGVVYYKITGVYAQDSMSAEVLVVVYIHFSDGYAFSFGIEDYSALHGDDFSAEESLKSILRSVTYGQEKSGGNDLSGSVTVMWIVCGVLGASLIALVVVIAVRAKKKKG